AAWTWGGGWLSKTWATMSLGAGYVDFAGSGVVHMTGGVAALAGAMVLGPRIGKYSSDGKAMPMPGHHLPMAMLGTFILLFGWFGFNAASTLSATDVQFATVATNTAISGAFGAVVAMLWITKRTGKPNPAMMINGMLAGLVAITAPCAFVAPWAAAVIGSIAAVLVIESTYFVEERLRIDDPCGAISVHGVCGMFGLLAVGVFANGSYGARWNGSESTGVAGIIDGNWGQLGAQALGAVTILVVNFGLSYGFFKLQNRLTKGGIRSSAADEIAGLDSEMGVSAYTEFELVRHNGS
ncbi:MAG: ammonium transporter, partial [Acidimicrobiaceae bacterium]